MSRVAWLIASVVVSGVACSSSGSDDSAAPPSSEESDVSRGADGTSEQSNAGREGSDSYTFQTGPGGLMLETDGGGTRRSFECGTVCEMMCGTCLYEACIASGAPSDACTRSRGDCVTNCDACPQGGTPSACFSPCLKGEPRCFAGLDIVMPDDVGRPEVTPDEARPAGEQVRPEDVTPSDDVRPSSDSTPSEQSTPDQGSSSSSNRTQTRD
jgi:hypothetical protein